jgi:3-deoxy-D-manno-octulosonic-acid transferase
LLLAVPGRRQTILIDFINNQFHVKFIIAPHNIKDNQIALLKMESQKKQFVLRNGRQNLADFDVFIIDSIGILTKSIVMLTLLMSEEVLESGVHNLLEPATFGVQIVYRPYYSHFAEATALVNMGGCVSISTKKKMLRNI